MQAGDLSRTTAAIFLGLLMVVSASHLALGADEAVKGNDGSGAEAGHSAEKTPETKTPQTKPDENAARGAAKESHEEPIKQIKLTDDQVKSFISAQPDLTAVSAKLQQAGNDPDAALKGELDGIAKKHGFADFAELDNVAANIAIVMAGLDAQTGAFTDPVDALKKELADVTADASLPKKDKEQLIQELTDAIKTTPPLEHKENVDVVKAHRNEIEKALE